jgi:hypothetical protein
MQEIKHGILPEEEMQLVSGASRNPPPATSDGSFYPLTGVDSVPRALQNWSTASVPNVPPLHSVFYPDSYPFPPGTAGPSGPSRLGPDLDPIDTGSLQAYSYQSQDVQGIQTHASFPQQTQSQSFRNPASSAWFPQGAGSLAMGIVQYPPRRNAGDFYPTTPPSRSWRDERINRRLTAQTSHSTAYQSPYSSYYASQPGPSFLSLNSSAPSYPPRCSLPYHPSAQPTTRSL